VWLQYLEEVRTNPQRISAVDASKHYPHRDDGYRVVINTTNPPGNTEGISNSIFLGTVFGQGDSIALSAAPDGICQLQQEFVSLIPKDSIGTDSYQDGSVTPQKLQQGGNFSINSACFSTLIASSNAHVPLQPLHPTSSASRRYSQLTGFGIAGSKTAFRFSYDGDFNIRRIEIEGDNVGFVAPVYDGLCNITQLVESFDGQSMSHVFGYVSQDGTSLVNTVQENGV